MKIITISREFGSGGRELGKRLADTMGFDYYDNEIISAVAKNNNLDERYVQGVLGNNGWRNYPITFRSTIFTSHLLYADNINLLLEQKKVIEQIAKMDKDFVIVGRNADVILAEYEPFNIFVCAGEKAKLARCLDNRRDDENLTEKQFIKYMNDIDKGRAKTREILTGAKWGERSSYSLIINSTGFDIKELVEPTKNYINAWFGRAK